MSCVARKQKKAKRGKHVSRRKPKEVKLGYLAEDVGTIKIQKWWCGDYACNVGGTIYKAGDVQRICFVTPPATGCPLTTTLGDGSSWGLTGGCRQDG